MWWLYLAIIAYLINACVFIIDKYLLSSPIPKYSAYAFGVSILSLASLLLIPFGVAWQGLGFFLIAITCGVSFFVGLTFLYKAIKESDVSVAATQTGTLGAIFTFIFSVLILKEKLAFNSLFAFVLLVCGIFLLGKIDKRTLRTSILAGLSFGLSYVLLKLSFNSSNFVNGLFWSRMGFVGTALSTLLSPKVRSEISLSYKNSSNNSKVLFLFNKFLAGIGFILLYFAIRLGSVSLVNALLGLQFMFTFLLVTVLKDKVFGIKEKLEGRVLASKIVGISCVVAGLLMLFIYQR